MLSQLSNCFGGMPIVESLPSIKSQAPKPSKPKTVKPFKPPTPEQMRITQLKANIHSSTHAWAGVMQTIPKNLSSIHLSSNPTLTPNAIILQLAPSYDLRGL